MVANANDLAMIVNYDHNNSFIVLATVITIINYDHHLFIVQATGPPDFVNLRKNWNF